MSKHLKKNRISPMVWILILCAVLVVIGTVVFIVTWMARNGGESEKGLPGDSSVVQIETGNGTEQEDSVHTEDDSTEPNGMSGSDDGEDGPVNDPNTEDEKKPADSTSGSNSGTDNKKDPADDDQKTDEGPESSSGGSSSDTEENSKPNSGSNSGSSEQPNSGSTGESSTGGSENSGSNSGASDDRDPNFKLDPVQRVDADYEKWLAATMLIGISMEYPECQISGIYTPSQTSIADKNNSDGVYVVFKSRGKTVTIHSEALNAERSASGTRDISAEGLGFATFDTISSGSVNTASMSEIEIADLEELIQQSLLVSVYSR